MLRVGCFVDWTVESTAAARLLASGSGLAGSGRTSRNEGQRRACATFWDHSWLTLRAREPADESSSGGVVGVEKKCGEKQKNNRAGV